MKLLLILVLVFQISLLINNNIDNNNIFVNCENNNIQSEMTGINDIINKHYKEYTERNPNIQQSNHIPYEQQNDPIRGKACDHDNVMQRKMQEIQEYKRQQRELKEQQKKQDQNQETNNQ